MADVCASGVTIAAPVERDLSLKSPSFICCAEQGHAECTELAGADAGCGEACRHVLHTCIGDKIPASTRSPGSRTSGDSLAPAHTMCFPRDSCYGTHVVPSTVVHTEGRSSQGMHAKSTEFQSILNSSQTRDLSCLRFLLDAVSQRKRDARMRNTDKGSRNSSSDSPC